MSGGVGRRDKREGGVLLGVIGRRKGRGWSNGWKLVKNRGGKREWVWRSSGELEC